MAFTIDHIKEFWKHKWKPENALGGSQLAVLFPNDLTQKDGAFNSIVKFPVMTEISTQSDWNQKTGFNELDASEKIVEIRLSENFTNYTKIAKVNIPGPNWAANKMSIIESQEAADYDDFVLKSICEGVEKDSVYPTPVKITEKNLVAEIKKMEKQCKKNKWQLKNGIILVSSEVMTTILNMKLSSVTQNIENTNAVVTRILNKYSIVEADVDDYGFQMVALLPGAFSWVSAVETPLTSGEYTQGPYFGQIFTVINKFYGGRIIMEKFIMGYKNEDSNTPGGEKILDNTNSLNSFKSFHIDDLETNFSENETYKKHIKNTKRIILEARNNDAVLRAVNWIKKQIEDNA